MSGRMDEDPMLAGYTPPAPAVTRHGRVVEGPWRADTTQQSPLRLTPARLLAPTAIAPRAWLYGTYLLRQYMTLLVAEGGVGKSGFATLISMEIAAGRSVLGHRVHARANTALFNLEDPLDEMERSVAAAMLHHGFDEEELRGRLFLNSGRERRLTMASLAPDGTASVVFPDREALVAELQRNEVGLATVDPFVRSHELTENDNNHMAMAADAWCSVASEANCSVLLVHHRRKGGDASEGIDAARGGKALSDAARVGLLLSRMTPEEAERAGVAPRDCWRHVRVDDPKVNLAPPVERATWMRLVGVRLGNGTPDYPEGDTVRTLEAWTPSSPFEGLADADINDALDLIAAGPGQGELFTASRRNSTARWVGKVVMERLDRSEEQARAIVSAWQKSGLLVEDEYHSKRNGRAAKGVRVDDTKRPGPAPQ